MGGVRDLFVTGPDGDAACSRGSQVAVKRWERRLWEFERKFRVRGCKPGRRCVDPGDEGTGPGDDSVARSVSPNNVGDHPSPVSLVGV